MNYKNAKAAIHTIVTVPDGYNGHIARIGFAFDPATGCTITVTVADRGCYRAELPKTDNELESKLIVLQRDKS